MQNLNIVTNYNPTISDIEKYKYLKRRRLFHNCISDLCYLLITLSLSTVDCLQGIAKHRIHNRIEFENEIKNPNANRVSLLFCN